MSILLMLIATTSAVVFSGLENEETTWIDTETTTPTEPIDSIGYLFNLGIGICLLLVLAVLILGNYYKDNKGITVGYVIAEACVIISLMFLIVGIEVLSTTFIVSAFVAQIIPLKLMIDNKKTTIKN